MKYYRENRWSKQDGKEFIIMIIKNGKVFRRIDYKVTDLYIENGRIVSSTEEVTDKAELDASGLKVLPGLVDILIMVRSDMIFRCRCRRGLKAILQYEKSQESLLIVLHP